jgi:hypothetical protein
MCGARAVSVVAAAEAAEEDFYMVYRFDFG